MRTRRRDAAVAGSILPYFIAGNENRLAAFVCRSDSSFLAGTNPILLTGATGSGKTALALHLAAKLAADRHTVSAINPWQGYLVASEFCRQYAQCVDSGDMDSFRFLIDGSDVLVVDDLHLMFDKPAAQEELALRLTARVDAGLPTILTCRRMPSDVRGMRPSLVSRSLPGLTIPIRLPSATTRRVILAELAVFESLEVDASTLDVLSTGLGDDLPVRQLHAAIKQMALWCHLHQSPPTVAAAQYVLNTLCNLSVDVSITDITRCVARYFRLRPTDLRSDSRRQNVVRARSLAMTLSRRITSLSLNQIGAEFGGRDHTTVLHAIRKTESLLLTDADLRRAADEVSEKFAKS